MASVASEWVRPPIARSPLATTNIFVTRDVRSSLDNARHDLAHHLDEAHEARRIELRVRIGQIKRQRRGPPIRHEVQQPALREIVVQQPRRADADAEPKTRGTA